VLSGGIRRRPGRAAILAAAALCLAAGCGRPLTPYLAQARAAVRRAEASLAERAPERARAVAALAEEAERVTARELARPRWRRDPERVAAAWDRVVGAATRAVAETARERRGAEERWRAVAPRAEAALAAARRAAATPGVASGAKAVARQAAVDLDRARRLAAIGAWAEAGRAAESSLARAGEVHAHWQALHRRFDDPAARALWRGWIEEAVAATRRDGRRVLVVDKLRRELIVYANGRASATYPVELGLGGLAPKRHAGDRATPEGRYRVVERKERGATRYHKALLLDYPNREDRLRFELARRRGEIPRGVGAGGLIEIHGHGGRGRDWTDGCVALTNPLMDRIYALAPEGTPVVIVGTRPGAPGGRPDE
jgi:lipoprotein-anchoring transpeptidase ErfK/SrfK